MMYQLRGEVKNEKNYYGFFDYDLCAYVVRIGMGSD